MTIRILHWLSRFFLAGIFLFSGYIKLQSPLQFAAVLAGYRLFPESLLFPIAAYFPWIEFVLGVLLIAGWKLRYVSVAAAGLLSMFIVVLSITYLRGIDARCGCFSFEDRISPLSIARDILFLVPAIFLSLESTIRARMKSGDIDSGLRSA